MLIYFQCIWILIREKLNPINPLFTQNLFDRLGTVFNKGLLPAKIGISVFQMARVLNALNTYRGPAITTPKYRKPGCVECCPHQSYSTFSVFHSQVN